MKIFVTCLVFTLLTIVAIKAQEVQKVANPDSQPIILGVDSQTLQQNIDILVKKYPVELSSETFIKRVMDYKENKDEWVYRGDKPAIVEFYALWNEPSNILSPIIDEVAREYGDQIYVYKVNASVEIGLIRALDIRSLPTLLFIPQNSAPQVSLGTMMKDDIIVAIESVLLQDK